MRPVRRAAALAIALASCAGGEGSDLAVSTDSAGVRIVESRGPQWRTGYAWRVSDAPVLRIGDAEGSEAYQLYRVRAALRLPDGRLVIANEGTHELRFYDSTGTHLFSRGRYGDGPGEFRQITGVWLVGDSLVISDMGRDRVTVYLSGGDFGRTFMLDRSAGPAVPLAIGAFEDGSLLVRRYLYEPDSRSGVRRMRHAYLRYSSSGLLLDSIGAFAGAEVYSATSGNRSLVASAPFGRSSSLAVHGDRVFVGVNDTYEIRVLGTDGTLETLIRRPIPNRAVAEEDIAGYRDVLREEAKQWGPALEALQREMVFPATMPAFGKILVDATGCLWVADYDWHEDDDQYRWAVFDPEGRLLGNVEVPHGGSVREIGADYLLGVWRDELGVEQVRLYRLIKD